MKTLLLREDSNDYDYQTRPAGENTNEEHNEVLPEESVLPLLELRTMEKRHAIEMPEVKKRDSFADEPVIDNQRLVQLPQERIMRLSGCVVEVQENDGEMDVASLPNSFQVETYKLRRHSDGRTSSTLVDKLIFTAIDQESKKQWIKHIKNWNRYGWRDTTLINAEHRDYMLLHELLITGEKIRIRSSTCSSATSSTGSTTSRRTRRRFYRTNVAHVLAPPP